MFVIREILSCKPGKVRSMVENFEVLSETIVKLGGRPLRLMTDVSGERFWTLVAEVTVETIEEFFDMEQRVMANEALRARMAGYHDLIESGRREIYRIAGS
jgi:hypothetical protein